MGDVNALHGSSNNLVEDCIDSPGSSSDSDGCSDLAIEVVDEIFVFLGDFSCTKSSDHLKLLSNISFPTDLSSNDNKIRQKIKSTTSTKINSHANKQNLQKINDVIHLILSSNLMKEIIQEQKPQQAKGLQELTVRQRNRRYRKLEQLKKGDFFEQESIKLRHPMLYHTYLGATSSSRGMVESSLSQFLMKDLVNQEYKQLLQKEMERDGGEKMEIQQCENDNNNHKESLNIEDFKNQHSHLHLSHIEKNSTWGKIQKSVQKIQQSQSNFQNQLDEQNLIDHAEELFLNGKVKEIDYSNIDMNQEYDFDEEEDFVGEQDKEEDQRINREFYTGILDY